MKRMKVACSLSYHNPSKASLTMVRFDGLRSGIEILACVISESLLECL